MKCIGDASVKDVGLWVLSVYCVYYNVSREDMKPRGLCPVKMMSYAAFFFKVLLSALRTDKLFILKQECLKQYINGSY